MGAKEDLKKCIAREERAYAEIERIGEELARLKGADAALREAKAQIAILRAALGNWRCDECMNGETLKGDCEKCHGTGRHPNALAALGIKFEDEQSVKTDEREQLERALQSWYCEPCAVEVYDRRCSHCGKTEREQR